MVIIHISGRITRANNLFDVGPTLYKCYANDVCLLGGHPEHT